MCLLHILIINRTPLLRHLLSFSNQPTTPRKNKTKPFFPVFTAQQSPSATQVGTLKKDTRSCNTIFVVKACWAGSAMTAGTSLLSPSYLSDMSCCCMKSSHRAEGHLSTAHAYLPISSPVQRGGSTSLEERWLVRILARAVGIQSLQDNPVSSQCGGVRSDCHRSRKHIKQIPLLV